MQRDLRALTDGALGGVAGTAVMSGVMLAARRAGLVGELPPGRITKAALDATGVAERGEASENVVATLLHFGFGAGVGGLFGVLHRRLRLPIDARLHGLIFASLVWFLSYQGWVPTLGIMPSAARDRPDRPIVMVLAHWVYGALLGEIVARREPEVRP